MILLIGEGENESMSKRILAELQKQHIDVIWIDQNSLPVENRIYFYPEKGKVKGSICFHGEITIDIEDFSGIYSRMSFLNVDLNLNQHQEDFLQVERSIALDAWLEHANTIVVNPIKSQRSNGSKLYQSWVVQKYGFKIPQCLVTNNPNKAVDFYDRNKTNGVIYKSASGERSIVKKLNDEDLERFNNLAGCPTLFQSFVPGVDIRIHTLVTGEVFATEIVSHDSDYRYDSDRSTRPIEIPDKLKETCINLTRDLGLYLSGIDTRKTPDGDYYCFEVNPSPAFSWYEDQTGQPIANAVANMLINGKDIYKSGIVKRKY
ncbi:MAG: glutathione synthase [Cyanobacteriota bacterium]